MPWLAAAGPHAPHGPAARPPYGPVPGPRASAESGGGAHTGYPLPPTWQGSLPRTPAPVSTIHDRMPVILHRVDEGRWLDPDLHDPADLAPLLAPYPAAQMAAHPVST